MQALGSNSSGPVPPEPGQGQQDDHWEPHEVPGPIALYHEREKWMGKGAQVFGADPKLSWDNKLHEASMLRLPVVELRDFWHLMPLKLNPVFKNIPLKHWSRKPFK
jgi:hypothetical protein